jgi:DNA-binding LytR/AlgR family response regulator
MAKIITMRNEKEYRVIDTDKILYVEVSDYLCGFYMDKDDGSDSKNVFVCTKSLKEIALELPGFFVRIRRDCIVNAKRFKYLSITKKEIVLDNGVILKISSRNIKPFIEAIEKISFAG